MLNPPASPPPLQKGDFILGRTYKTNETNKTNETEHCTQMTLIAYDLH